MQHGGEPFGALGGGGIRNGTPLSWMVCLARVIRRVMVASGTRNARAISAVVRPPTARSVSAICDGGDSDGWQHRNSRTSVSSASSAPTSAGGPSQSAGQRPAGAPFLAPPPGLLGAQQVGQPARRRP